MTEQPKLAVLCGKMRTRFGLKYCPKGRGDGNSGAVEDYKRWLRIVQRCVVDSWNVLDRTDPAVWESAEHARMHVASTKTSVSSTNRAMLSAESSAHDAAALGEIVDTIDAMITQVEHNSVVVACRFAGD